MSILTNNYPPPNPVILTNLCHALLSDAHFYLLVMRLASQTGHSNVYLRKTSLISKLGCWSQDAELEDRQEVCGLDVDTINNASVVVVKKKHVQPAATNNSKKNQSKVKVVIKTDTLSEEPPALTTGMFFQHFFKNQQVRNSKKLKTQQIFLNQN